MTYTDSVLILQEAIRIAAKTVADNPPGDISSYTSGMMWALTGGNEREKRWQTYFIGEAIKSLGMEDN